MTSEQVSRTEPRVRLSRNRIVQAAMAQADVEGLEAVSMRNLAEDLGFAPMALYRHVSSKDDLIDGMVDAVFGEIEGPDQAAGWRAAMRQRATSLLAALVRHRWAVGLMESRRNAGPASLGHHDAVIGCLRAAGFSLAMAAHAYSVLDSYIYGFALTKMNFPFQSSDEVAGVAQNMLEPFPSGAYPHLVEFITDHAMKLGYDYGDEFEYGLDLILDGLDRARQQGD